jgi:carbonic anhydrase
MDSHNAACAGKRQSPIAIETGRTRTAALPGLEFHYRPTPLNIVDNGHTIQVNMNPGNWLSVGGHRYELTQFHFHRPSEEIIDGKRFAMVAHLVHRDADGHLAVVAVPLIPGHDNALVESLWHHLPAAKDKEASRPEVKINAAALLPVNLGYYAYTGSLTTPPCSEGVRWMVLKTPTAISAHEVDVFAARYPNDARPIQPLNGREVISSR